MDSNGLRNLIRRSQGPVVFCVVALWGAVGAATSPGETARPSDRAPMTLSLFMAPVLTAADVDPDAPTVYRLPPVAQPALTDDELLVDVQPADQRPETQGPMPPAPPQLTQPPSDDWYGLMPSVDEPIPEDLGINADAPVQRDNSYAHQDTDRPDAADHNPRDAHVGGGPVVELAVEAGVLPYTPTAVELTAQLLPTIQHACGLAERGATFAAQAEFIQVLRRIAQSLDAQSDSDEHARALAAGLRALNEADDFAPRGTQLEAELDVAMMASSHRTPVLAGGTVGISPQEAAALYLSYAQQQLGRAVAGQQAGSMALHAMGKLQCRTAQNGDDVQSLRKAMTMYLAAIEACPRNNLATNELGVLLAHNGHYVEAETMFRRAVTISPTSTGYHNLAVVEQKLGRPQQAIANQQQADRLAAWERANGDVSRRMGIQWVSPDVLARAGEATETSAEAVAGVGRTQPATATAPSGPAARPAFAPPPLASDATEPAAPARIARPLPAQTRRQLW